MADRLSLHAIEGGRADESPFDAIDRDIEELHAKITGCRQTILLARAIIALGALAMLASFFFYAWRTPPVILASIAAMIGGVVWGGASGATREGLAADLAQAEAEKARLIDDVAQRNGWRDLTPTVH